MRNLIKLSRLKVGERNLVELMEWRDTPLKEFQLGVLSLTVVDDVAEVLQRFVQVADYVRPARRRRHRRRWGIHFLFQLFRLVFFFVVLRLQIQWVVTVVPFIRRCGSTQVRGQPRSAGRPEAPPETARYSAGFDLLFFLFGKDVADGWVLALGYVSVAAVNGVRRRRVVLLLPPVGATDARRRSYRWSFNPPHCNSNKTATVVINEPNDIKSINNNNNE